MAESIVAVHNGIRFKVEAFPKEDLFVGRFTILDTAVVDRVGADDTYRPTTDNAWATPTEALNYATEAAHHVIEGIPPFTEGQPQ